MTNSRSQDFSIAPLKKNYSTHQIKIALKVLATLQKKVDSLFNRISQKWRPHFRCFENCHHCCKSNLFISPLEALQIQKHVAEFKELETKLLSLEKKRIERTPDRCPFLEFSGGCSIYEVRPIVCRSHGAPIFYQNSENKRVCGLNFKGVNLSDFYLQYPEDFIVAEDTLNSLNSIHEMAGLDPNKKVALSPQTIINEEYPVFTDINK